VAEVDVEIPVDVVIKEVRDLRISKATEKALAWLKENFKDNVPQKERVVWKTSWKNSTGTSYPVLNLEQVAAEQRQKEEPLRDMAVDGYLRASGRGRAPDDLSPEAVKKILAARPEEFVEIFPVGWERVTATGRVVAQRRARVRAYEAMKARVPSIRMSPTATVGDAVRGAPAAEALLDVFVAGLPLAGPPRLMPDCVAEVDVAAPVRDLIKVLKEVRALEPAKTHWTDEQIDQLSINLKAERLTVTGRGMPPTDQVRPPEALAGEPGPPMPDWAAAVLEGRGVAIRPDDVEDEAESRLLAARSAKARAAEQIERHLDDVRLDDGRTVRDRAAKDDVFRKDITTLLASAGTVRYQAGSDGKQWEVVLRLPLVRLWEFSRPRE